MRPQHRLRADHHGQDHPAAVDTMGHDAPQSLCRGCAGLPKLPKPDATHRVDNAAENHHHSPGMANRMASATPMAAAKGRGHSRCPSQGDPRLLRGQTPTAVGFGRNSENPECESPAITAGRGSPVFPLTQAGAGRINKQEPAHANTLERKECGQDEGLVTTMERVGLPVGVSLCDARLGEKNSTVWDCRCPQCPRPSFSAMVSTLDSGRIESLADLLSTFNHQNGVAVADKAFHNRLARIGCATIKPASCALRD